MITLIGHGYVGEYIAKELSNQNILYHWIHHYDVVDQDTTVIINAAAYTGNPNVDACETNKQETINGNVIYPVNLELKHQTIPIIHLTTGCVYTGYKEGGWTEEDEPNFNFDNGSFYCASKALKQRILMQFMNKSYLLRIRMPFGNNKHPKNLLTKLENYNKLVDFKNSISYVVDIARVAVYFAKNKPQPGIYNVCNPGSTTTKELSDRLGLKKEWFTQEEFLSSVVVPRANCILNTDKLEKIFPIQHINNALNLALESYK